MIGQRPRNRQEARSLRTRERLADAAVECLVERGYRGTNFVEVCRRAGLTRGAAHHHYRDLTALMLDAVRRVNDRLLEGLAPVLSDAAEPGKRVDAALDVLWETSSAPGFEALLEIWMAQSHDVTLRTRLRTETNRYAAEIVEGLGRAFPELRGAEATEAVRLVHLSFLVALGAGFARATLFPSDGDPEWTELRELLKRMVARELSAIEAGRRASGSG